MNRRMKENRTELCRHQFCWAKWFELDITICAYNIRERVLAVYGNPKVNEAQTIREGILKMMSTRKSFVRIEKSCCVLNVIIWLFSFILYILPSQPVAAFELKCRSLNKWTMKNKTQIESRKNIHHCGAIERRTRIFAHEIARGGTILSQLTASENVYYFIFNSVVQTASSRCHLPYVREAHSPDHTSLMLFRSIHLGALYW